MKVCADYSVMLMSGVYAITNTANGKRYIGSTKRLKDRAKAHATTLRAGRHHCRPLQSEWDEYGESSFVFEPLVVCGLSELQLYEQRALDACRSPYNVLRSVCSNREAVPTEETRISAKMRQRWSDPNERERMSATIKRALMDDDKRGRILTAIREAAGRPDVRRKRSEISKKVWADEGRRRRMSEVQRARLSSPDARARLSAAKRILSDEQVRDVRLMLKEGISMLKISKRLGLSTGLICNINTGKSYAGVGLL